MVPLFLPPPRECGLNGYPAIPSLCNGRTRFRSTCPPEGAFLGRLGRGNFKLRNQAPRTYRELSDWLSPRSMLSPSAPLLVCIIHLSSHLSSGIFCVSRQESLLRSKDAASERSRQQEAFGKERTFPLDIREKIRYDTLTSKTNEVRRHRRLLKATEANAHYRPAGAQSQALRRRDRPGGDQPGDPGKAPGDVEGI